jgi:hypothetical protein
MCSGHCPEHCSEHCSEHRPEHCPEHGNQIEAMEPSSWKAVGNGRVPWKG